ncbi:transcriptional regulator [Vermiconidia calcicola]|uniref:Transcriptional regulator n=1 Tax=Vermiconidia calcicola TaxID=1690605 RepID=A0ACC3NEP3_9PEZI|nr:transcriptional regulator [Vermiconidia calcicola]
MAAVQPTQGMQQHGHNNTMAAQASNILPPGMTKDGVTQIYRKYQQMKQQGVPDTDPEMLRARSILQSIQQKQDLLKKQQAHRQAQLRQQQQLLAQQPGQDKSQPQPDGASVAQNATSTPATDHPQQHQTYAGPANGAPQTTSAESQAGVQSSIAPAQADGAPEHAFSKDQLMTLRAQMAAFAHLQKNTPIPSSIQDRIFTSKQEQSPPTPSEGVVAVSKALDNATKAMRGAGTPQTDGKPRHIFETFTDPHTLLLKHIGYGDHTHRPYRPMIPSIMPLGVDPERVREERENMIYNRVVARKQELAKMSANIGGWDTSKSDMPSDNTNVKLQNLIEYKMLCLLPKQREMRQKISREMALSDDLSMTANRTMYRRVKKQSLREARITEKLEKQQRDAAETKEKKKHMDFVRSITQHAEDIRNSAQQHKARVQKLGRMMVQQHSRIEQEEQKRVERTAKQRLQALKANDEETYLKLLGQAKDSRISHLLKQTDGFLNQLAASVKSQQRNMVGRYGGPGPDESEEEEEEEEGDDDAKAKVDYYKVAHRVQEDIKVQSNNLVGGTLKEYQIKGLQWMISLYNNNLNGILADEMGLGKTIQTISLITYLIEKKAQTGPFLVIVPLSTLTNWNNEFEKWAPTVQRIVYKGPPNQRKNHQNQIRYGNFQVLLTTYEFIIKDRPVLSKVKWVHMIVDEGHRMKNAGSKLSSTITQYYHTRYRLILTGTPLQNNLPELWALLNFVLPNIFKSVKSFDEWFNTPFANTGGQDKMDLTEEEQLLVIRRLHKVLRPFLLRRLKKDVEKDLPDKQERVIKCQFSALQAKLYNQLVKYNRITVSDQNGKKTGMRGLSNMLMQLRKLCNHPFVFEEVENQMNPRKLNDDLLWRTAGKFELLDRILPKLKATGHRVLMFFQMTQIMNIMEDFMRLRDHSYLRLDGATKADDRSELLKQFNAPDSPYFCFLLSTRAGGLGLNLQTADTVIIYDSDWNPHQDLQAQDRAHRIGQKNEVRILRLISSNSVEEKILERAQFKLDMDGKVIQAGKFDNKSTNEERDEMLRVMLESAEAAENLEQEEMDDEDLNVIMMRSDDELIKFQQMDADRVKNDKYGPDKKYGRLLGESELPDIYLNEDNPVVEEIEFNLGRGARERKGVKYDDGLTEEQWLDAVDADDDTIEEAAARKQARIAKRATNKETRLRGEYDLGKSPPASREPSESPAPKKRGRKPNKPDKRKADEASLDGIAEPPKKRGRTKNVDTLSKQERETLQTILDNVHDSLQDLEEESNDPDVANRGIIDPFLDLPPKQYYPDYYELIKEPICMKQIETKINKKQYQSLRQFRQDIGLLCNNCRQYNEDGSVLYNDANLIENALLEKLREETANHPEWQDFDESGDGASTRPISSVGTPQPPQKSGFKLKLNGARANGTSSRGGTDSLAQSDDDE